MTTTTTSPAAARKTCERALEACSASSSVDPSSNPRIASSQRPGVAMPSIRKAVTITASSRA